MSEKMENALFQRNMEVFVKRYPQVADKFQNKEYERDETTDVEVEYSYTGEPILVVKKEGQKKYLSGKYAPERPLLDWFEVQERISYEMVLFVIGMGNWIQITEFLNKVKQKVKIIIYEPSVEIFEKVMETYEVAEILEQQKVALVIEKINEAYLETFFLALIHREDMSVTKIYVSGNYQELFPEKVKEKVGELKKYFEQRMINWDTLIRYTDVVGENQLHNTSFYYHGYSTAQFKGILSDKVPAIVVSAGPSLNKNIDDLKDAIGKSCIIATDTAVKPLLNKGIQPHFVAIIDGKKPVLLFEHPQLSESALLTSTIVAKDVMYLHKGKKVFYNGGGFFEKGLLDAVNKKRKGEKLEIPDLPTGGSVANTAFSFALYMGAKTIILMGQDLAMTGNRTHADGTFKEKMDVIDTSSEQYFEVEGIDGGKIFTRPDFNHYRKWFEDTIEKLNKREKTIRVIDATEGGARIQGTEIMPLKEAICECCIFETDMDKKIADMPEMLSNKDKEILLDYFANTGFRLEKVRKKAKEGIGYYDRMITIAEKQNFNTSKYIETYKKVKKINNFMETDATARFVEDNLEEMQNAMLSTIKIMGENERDEYITIAKKGKIVLETMLPMIDTLSEIANNTVVSYKGDN